MSTKKGRPIDPVKSKREPYTTMVNPKLLENLRVAARSHKITVADLLEQLISNHLAT